MDIAKAIAYADAHWNEYVDLYLRVVAQPSVAAQDLGVRACGEILRGYLTDSGIEGARLLETGGQPVVYGELPGPAGAPTVVVYSHYDVQPADPVDAWKTPPFEPTVIDGRVFARGAGDNKGQLMANLLAVRSVLKSGQRPPVNLKFLYDGEEENGSPNLPAFVDANQDLLRADLCYFADGQVHPSNRPVVNFGVRGMLAIEFLARGAKTDLHSGHWGEVAPSASWNLVHLLASMKDPQGNVLVDGFYDEVRIMTEADRNALDEIPFDEREVLELMGTDRIAGPPQYGFFEKALLRPSMNLSGFSAGYTGAGARSAIPSRSIGKMEMRLVPDQDPDVIFQKIAAHVQKVAPEITVRKLKGIPPSRTALDAPYSSAIIKAVGDAFGQSPILFPSVGATCADFVFTRTLNMPSFCVPYGPVDENQHSPNESFRLEDLHRGMRCMLNMMAEVSASAAGRA
jgi:acetylornithine deacetylase/succinyl-diaminopimelate desuccinylase-like protein